MNHDDIYENTWEDKEKERLPYQRNGVLSTVFSYARYAEGMEELPGFGLKNSLFLPSLANKDFKSLRDENYEPIYTYNEEYMRWFARQSIKGSRCSSLNQCYISILSDEVFVMIQKN